MVGNSGVSTLILILTNFFRACIFFMTLIKMIEFFSQGKVVTTYGSQSTTSVDQIKKNTLYKIKVRFHYPAEYKPTCHYYLNSSEN